MISQLKDFVRTRPCLFDRLRALERRLFPGSDPTYDLLDNFAQKRGAKVNFVQIGANDGLGNDPIGEFVIGDRW